MSMLYKRSICIICFFWSVFLQGQQTNNHHLIDVELQADEAFEQLSFKKALDLYKELEASSVLLSSELKFKVGVCYLEVYEYQDALEYLSDATKDTTALPLSFRYYLAKANQLNGKVKEAIIQYQKYLVFIKSNSDFIKFEDEILNEIIKCETAQRYYATPKDVQVQLVSEKINSKYDDYDPLIDANESVMYFTSDRPHELGGKVHELDGTAYEDIYRSFKTDTGWAKAEKVQELDADLDNACVALSHSGDKMILYRYASRGVFSKPQGHLYLTELKKGKWSKPKILPFSEERHSNDVSACFSTDDKTIYFSSDRAGGFGGKDIYKTTYNRNDWSKPENLGAKINTSLDEDAPFVHPSGKSFYFSSQGHENMGGFDIFQSQILSDSMTVPQNLGYPINTTTDDISFVMASDGKTAYLADNRAEGVGEMDIYIVLFLKETLGK